jgi:phosphopantothenoylcysteine decarboxylase/phosphopantothenate--cysteine ligase
MIAANLVGPARGFDAETNALEVFWPGGSAAIGEDRKIAVARQLISVIAERFAATRSATPGAKAAG